MRSILQSTKQFRSIFSCATNVCSRSNPFAGQLRLISLFKHAAQEINGEVNRQGPLVEYEKRIAASKLVKGDAFQVAAMKELQRLYDELIENAGACRLDRHTTSTKALRGRWLWSHFTDSFHSPVRGLYLHGGVGTGKTMMMDLFFDQLPHSWRKQRVHFHDFMLGVHSRLHKHRGLTDPLEFVAAEILEESILLCLDEFMVPDIAVALILHRFFGHLFRKGAILVATSNHSPADLYEGRLQRDLFLPFVGILKEKCVIHKIGSSVDYRQMSSELQGFCFLGKNVGSTLQQNFQQLVGAHIATPTEVEVAMGRKFPVPLGVNGCAYFTFDELCNKPLGAADYSALFKNFHTLALEGVPIFGVHNRPAAYRFVTLIDVMYDNKARLLYTAEGSPDELFERIFTISQAKDMLERTSSRSRENDDFDLCVDDKLCFSKYRTISRLTEMMSSEYSKQHAERLTEKQQSHKSK